jgi:hypothetical protein
MKMTSLALISAGALATIGLGPAEARRARAAPSMEACVARVLDGLARRRAPEGAAGSAVLARCDRPLRAALAAAIRAGEAGGCTVESCLDIARQEAAAEATQAYQRKLRR